MVPCTSSNILLLVARDGVVVVVRERRGVGRGGVVKILSSPMSLFDTRCCDVDVSSMGFDSVRSSISNAL